MAQNTQPQNSPSPQAELVVEFYRQKLADSDLLNANLWAENRLLRAQVEELSKKKDPNG